MDDFNLLRVFVRVAEARNFAEAGRRLGLTASAVSKAVSRLEASMGVRLFSRTTRHVGLTHDGAEFFERCVQILADIEAAETQLQRAVAEPRGRLRVHIPVGFGRKVVLPALARLSERYPALVIDAELGERTVDLAEEGVDAAIRFGDLPSSGLLARRLCHVPFIACAAPSYLARRGEPATPEELEQHSCIGYSTRWSAHYREWKFTRAGVPFSLNLSGGFNVNNVESMLDAAVAGGGIAMLASYMVSDAVREGTLKVVLRDFIAPGTPVSVVYLPGHQRSPRVQLFLDTLREVIGDDPAWNAV